MWNLNFKQSSEWDYGQSFHHKSEHTTEMDSESRLQQLIFDMILLQVLLVELDEEFEKCLKQ